MKELIFARTLLPTWKSRAAAVAAVDAATGRQVTFAEHASRVARLCDAVATKLGVGPTDRFAVLAINSIDYLELWHAGFLGAGVVNPLNLRLAPKELSFILGDAESEVCFTDCVLRAADREGPRPSAGLRHVVLIGGGDGPADMTYEELLDGRAERFPDEPDEDDPSSLMYTGGTTGLPKGVLLDAARRDAQPVPRRDGRAVGARTTSTPAPDADVPRARRWSASSASPMFGVPVGDPCRCSTRRGASTSSRSTTSRPTVMVPTMIGMLLNHPDFKPERICLAHAHRLRRVADAAALLEQLLAMLPGPRHLPGLRHDRGGRRAHVALRRRPPRGRRGSALGGRPSPASLLTIQDADGNVLPAGETGEVCARAGNFMREYWKRPEETAEGVPRTAGTTPGDAGYLDEQGYLFLVDRVKDMIVTGGENVYSVEVENAIASAPRGRAGRGHRHPPRDVGRGGARHRRAQGRLERHRRGRDHRARPRDDRRLQGARSRSSSAPSRCRCRAR